LLQEANVLAGKSKKESALFGETSKKSSLFDDDDDEIEKSLEAEIAKYKVDREKNLQQVASKHAPVQSAPSEPSQKPAEPLVEAKPVTTEFVSQRVDVATRKAMSLFDEDDDDDTTFGGSVAKYKAQARNAGKTSASSTEKSTASVYIPAQAVEARTEEDKAKTTVTAEEASLLASIGADDELAGFSAATKAKASATGTTAKKTNIDDLLSKFKFDDDEDAVPGADAAAIGDDFDWSAYIDKESKREDGGLFE
jgi:hypothetical protein